MPPDQSVSFEMDPDYFPLPQAWGHDWEPEWEPWGPDQAEGLFGVDYQQVLLRIADMGREATRVLDATFDQFAEFGPRADLQAGFGLGDLGVVAGQLVNTAVDYVARSHQLHDFAAGETSLRAFEHFTDEELTAGAVPVNLVSLKTGSVPGKDLADVHRSTHFQRHWAGMVRAEFVGYWGSRAEQLCAARWLRLQLKALNVRDAHIATVTPMILSLAKLPTADEDAAAAFESSDAFKAVLGRLSWPRRFIRWVLGKKYIARRKTVYVQAG